MVVFRYPDRPYSIALTLKSLCVFRVALGQKTQRNSRLAHLKMVYNQEALIFLRKKLHNI